MARTTPKTYEAAKALFSRYRQCRERYIKWGLFGRVLLCVMDFINGVWSGFPICCIWYFCTRAAWSKYPNAVQAFFDTVHDDDDYMYWLGQSGYVCCPACAKAKYHIPRSKIRSGGISIGWLINKTRREELVRRIDGHSDGEATVG